jgi:hypothetical protein
MSSVADVFAALLRALDVQGGAAPPLHVALLVLARVTPLTVLAPFFLLRPAPPLVRAGVALALSAALAPLAYAHARFAFAPHELPLLLGVEALRGALFAFAVALPIMALEGAGQWLDALRGAQHGGGSGPSLAVRSRRWARSSGCCPWRSSSPSGGTGLPFRLSRQGSSWCRWVLRCPRRRGPRWPSAARVGSPPPSR